MNIQTAERKFLLDEDSRTVHILAHCSVRDLALFLEKSTTQARTYIKKNNLNVTRELNGKTFHGDIILPDQKFKLVRKGRPFVAV